MLISVALPTYKRLPQLKRAVSDVFSQTWKDWELVISDDEEGTGGETWRWLQKIASADARVRIVKNTRGKHGQIYNVNSACLATKGDWIKPFFDDDRMLPNCLETFADVICRAEELTSREPGCPDVVMAGCRAQKWRNGVHVGDEKNFVSHAVEVIDGRNVLKAMCLQDAWNGRTPTHMIMRGDIVRGGALMVENADFKHPLDVRWFSRVLEQGSLAMTDSVLVGECQGEVASGTSELWREEPFVTEELRKVYLEIYDRANHDATWPSRLTVDCVKCGTRGIYHLSRRQFVPAFKFLLLMLRSPIGIYYTGKWLLCQRFSKRFTATSRIYAKV